VAILAVWLGVQVNDARRQESAIAAITAVDGYFYYDFQYDGEKYSQREYPQGPEWLWKRVNLSFVSNVVAVGLNSKAATNETLEEIGYLQHLEVLDLTNSLISDRGLEHVGGLRRLKYLRLDGTNVTDAGLAELQNLTDLETLDVQNTKVLGKGLVTLNRLKTLRELYVTAGQVSPETIRLVQASLPQCTIETIASVTDE
jgi:hypothetical protein